MNKYQDMIQQFKHDARLSYFLNSTEEALPKKLKPVEELYGNVGYSVGDYNESPFSGFHPEAVRMVLREDDYYLSCRANHFILIFGYSEALPNWDDCVVCLANHKGGLNITVFVFINEEVLPDA